MTPSDRPTPWRAADLAAHPSFPWPEDEALRAGLAGDRAALRRQVAPLRTTLQHGPGVVLARGVLPVEEGEAAAGQALLALGEALGTPLSQSATGERLLGVRDHGYAPDDPGFRGPHSARSLAFHTDRCDVIGFGCVRPAAEGGVSEVVSSLGLIAHLQAHEPRIAEALAEPMPWKRHSIDPDNPRDHVFLPVWSEAMGWRTISYLRVLIDRADADPSLPSPTDAQRAALDRLDALAAEPGWGVRFTLQPGDVLLLNNHTTLHRRTAFTDPGPPGRLIWRVWLAMPDSRPLAPSLRDQFGDVRPGAVRGGIWPAGEAPWDRS